MPTKRRWLTIGGIIVFTGSIIVLGALLYLSQVNDLGLTRMDLRMGKNPPMDALRLNVTKAADACLAKYKSELANPADEIVELTTDNSKSSWIRSLGYRSSFYYYCWDIYLPYSLRTRSGISSTVVVHLSDSRPVCQHDLEKFHVLGILVLDSEGEVVKQVEGR